MSDDTPDPYLALRVAFIQALMGKRPGDTAAPTADLWDLARQVVQGATSKDALQRLHRALTVEGPDPIYAFFQRDPLLAGDASWQKRTSLLNQIEAAAALPRFVLPDVAKPRDLLEHLDTEPGGAGRVGDAIGPNVLLDIVRGPMGVGFRFVNIQTGSHADVRPVAFRALDTARGMAVAAPRYRGLGSRLTASEWRSLWPDPAGGLLVRYEAAKIALEDELVVDVHRGVLTRYALARLDENERALGKLLADGPALARAVTRGQLLRDAIAVREELDARLAAGGQPGLVPALGPTRADLEAASASWVAAFGDLPRVPSSGIRPSGLAAALARIRTDLASTRGRLVDAKQQAGDLDPWTIDAVRALADPTLLPRARAIVTARRGAAVATPADAHPEHFLATEAFLDAAVGAAAGIADSARAIPVGHLINETFDACLLRLAAVVGRDRDIVRRVVSAIVGKPASAIPLFAPPPKPRASGGSAAEAREHFGDDDPDIPKDSEIPDDEAAFPGVAWPAARSKNREHWRVLGLVKGPPFASYDPFHQPKGYANRVYRAQEILKQGGITRVENAPLVSDGVLGPRTLLALIAAAKDEKFPKRSELLGIAVDLDGLAHKAEAEERERAMASIHPSKILLHWTSEVKAEKAIHVYDVLYTGTRADADLLDHMFFGDDVPKGILWVDRFELLKRIYGRSGRTLTTHFALVSMDATRFLAQVDFAPFIANTYAYLRFEAIEPHMFVFLRQTLLVQEDAKRATLKLPRAQQEEAAAALSRLVDPAERLKIAARAPMPAGAGFLVAVHLPPVTEQDRATYVRPFLEEKAARKEAERRAKLAEDAKDAGRRADVITAILDNVAGDDDRIRMAKLLDALRGIPYDEDEAVLDDLAGRTPNRYQRLIAIASGDAFLSSAVLSLLLEMALHTRHGKETWIAEQVEKLSQARARLNTHGYVDGKCVLLDRRFAFNLGEVAADVQPTGNLYSRDHKKEQLRPEPQKKLNEALQRMAREYFIKLGEAAEAEERGEKTTTEDPSELAFTEELIKRAAQEAGVDLERDVEKVTQRESIRLIDVRRNTRGDGTECWDVEFERVTRIEHEDGSKSDWESVPGSRKRTHDGSGEFEYVMWAFSYFQTSKITIAMAQAVMIVATLCVLWEVGVIGILVRAAGGAANVLISIGISEATYFLTAREITFEGILGAGIEGYLGALGFKVLSPIGGAIAGKLLPVGVRAAETGIAAMVAEEGVASVITKAGFRKLVAHWILKTGIRGFVTGGVVSPASLFAKDLLRIAVEGKGELSSPDKYLESVKSGVLWGTVFELGLSSVLGPLTRANEVHSIKTAEELFKKVATSSEPVTLAHILATTAKGAGRMKEWFVTLMEEGKASSLHAAVKRRLAAGLEVANATRPTLDNPPRSRGTCGAGQPRRVLSTESGCCSASYPEHEAAEGAPLFPRARRTGTAQQPGTHRRGGGLSNLGRLSAPTTHRSYLYDKHDVGDVSAVDDVGDARSVEDAHPPRPRGERDAADPVAP